MIIQILLCLHKVVFADDTNLFLSHKYLQQLHNTVNEELAKVDTWFKCNKLSLNTGKTKFIYFAPVDVEEILKMYKLK